MSRLLRFFRKALEPALLPELRRTAPGLSVNVRFDHLVYATTDVARTILDLERTLGVRAAPGGKHPAWGTHNALLSLGERTYLEIIGPDPEAPPPGEPRPLGLDRLEKPRLATWVAATDDLERVVECAGACGIDLGGIAARGRTRPDGVRLSWRMTDLTRPRAGGAFPFFIDWGVTPHPAETAPAGGTLAAFRIECPDPDPLRAALAALGLNVPVTAAEAVTLIAEIRTPRGTVTLS